MISASPNSLGPPIEACAKYLRMEKCDEYGRNKLTIWRSPLLFPNVGNEDDSKGGFLDQQVTSIVWILQRFLGELPRLKVADPETDEYLPDSKEDKGNRKKLQGPKYSGGILADSMGLGKTLSCIACLELMAGQELNVIKKKPDGRRMQKTYRPMAILAPNATVAAQWIEEICQSTDPETISQIITSGNGLRYRAHPSGRVRSLTAEQFASKSWPADVEYVWKEKEKRAAKTIIIMSIDTFAGRTVEVSTNAAGQATFTSSFTRLKRRFSIVVVDEAHKVKNDATRNWKAVSLLDRQFTLLVTATPTINSVTDLMGLARLLWPVPSEYLKGSKRETWDSIEENITKLQDLRQLDDVNAWDDMRLVAGRPGLLAKMLCRNKGANHDIQLIRDYLKYFESLAILRRSPTSKLYSDWEMTKSVSLEGLFPNVDYRTADIQLEPELGTAYQTVHLSLLMDYVKVVNNMRIGGKRTKGASDAKTKTANISVIRCHRLLQIASASVDVYNLDKLLTKNKFGTMSKHIAIMRRARIDFLRLSQFLLDQEDPSPESALDYVKIAIRRSPVLRFILFYINENILDRKKDEKVKKLLITEASPILAYYYELVLQFLGLHCRTFHAELSQEARKDLVADFNSDDDKSCQILIQMYTVGFAGSNLHKNCSRVLVASQASSLAVQWQAIHRVIRVGQMSDVTVHRIKVKNSYHSFRESRQVEKLLPELGSRAQGSTNEVLVKILNYFQGEVDVVWASPQGRKLVADKNLLDDVHDMNNPGNGSKRTNAPDDQGDVDSAHDSKRQKLDDGSALPTNGDEAPATPGSSSAAREDPQPKAEPGSAGWLCDDDEDDDSDAAFLAMKTRSEYYEEFKKLPKLAKSHFSHKKNMLRRMLSYGSPDGNQTTRVWTMQDLNDSPAVFERALELMVRVRLSAGSIHMVPLPQINFFRAPLQERIALQKYLAKVKLTEQDVEANRELMETPRKGVVKETLPGDTKIEASCSEIEKALEEARLGGVTAAQLEKAKDSVKNEDYDDDDEEVDMEDIPALGEEDGEYILEESVVEDNDALEQNIPEEDIPEENE